jgi:GTP cyclohydrolase I
MINLPDVQCRKPKYKIPINKVGVRNIKLPYSFYTKNGELFSTIATISSYCDLSEDLKGINMSRISRTINSCLINDSRGIDSLIKTVETLKQNHNTDNVYLKVRFDYIMEKYTPISIIESYEPASVEWEIILMKNKYIVYLTVKSTEMSLCPCSKEMSLLKNNLTVEEKEFLNNTDIPISLQDKLSEVGFGAHNQKSEVEIKVEVNLNVNIFIEDLIDIIKKGSSCPTLTTLKRQDEKYVTEISYMNKYIENGILLHSNGNYGPKFVEDITRDIANELNLILDDKINDYVIVVNNHESIHSGDIMATSVLTAGRKLK